MPFSNSIQGTYMQRPVINVTCSLDFSCDIRAYLEKFEAYFLVHGATYETIKNSIFEFIEGCLVLGEFLHHAKGTYARISSWECVTEFSLSYPAIRSSENPKELIFKGTGIHAIIRTTFDEKVVIRLMDQMNRSHTNTTVTFDSPDLLDPNYTYNGDFRLLGSCERSTKSYRLLKRKFSIPRYKKLPLYINTPFVKEYAREQLQNPPLY